MFLLILFVNNYYSQKESIKTISTYNFKSINGIEFTTDLVIEKNFRNGDLIKEAKTPEDWEVFIENKIPAYCYKDFNNKNTEFGLFYNFYAFIDSREIAPIGYHKMTVIDIISLEDEIIYTN